MPAPFSLPEQVTVLIATGLLAAELLHAGRRHEVLERLLRPIGGAREGSVLFFIAGIWPDGLCLEEAWIITVDCATVESEGQGTYHLLIDSGQRHPVEYEAI
jgi:hypothetical protein